MTTRASRYAVALTRPITGASLLPVCRENPAWMFSYTVKCARNPQVLLSYQAMDEPGPNNITRLSP